MDKLFGIPIERFALVSAIILVASLSILVISALRNPVLFKAGIRNILRRPAQTALIILGLMLATLLFSSALVTGDTMNNSIKEAAIKDLGGTDVVVTVKGEGANAGAKTYFGWSTYNDIRVALSGKGLVQFVTPIISETMPAACDATRHHLPSLSILGVEDKYSSKTEPLVSKAGRELDVTKLAPGEIFLNAEAAKGLNVKPGSDIKIFLGTAPVALKVAGVYEKGGKPASGASAIMRAPQLQTLIGRTGLYDKVLISGKGGGLIGVDKTKKIESALKKVFEDRVVIEGVKKKALDTGETAANLIAGLFLIFGQFSVAAGAMLIFLIFVMLAAERKTELGVLRALGSQRRDILKLFVFEGVVYAVIAAAVGTALGLVVGWGMVEIMAKAFGQLEEFKFSYHFTYQSLVISYALGVMTTFVVVVFSAWRAARLNIVRAIRDLPEPGRPGKSYKWLLASIAIALIGYALAMHGIDAKQSGFFMGGISLIIIGIPLMTRFFGLSERLAFTLSGFGLLLWWLLPEQVMHKLVPLTAKLNSGMEIFFLSGIAIVAGAIWVTMFNADLVIPLIVNAFGRFRGAPPVLRIAFNYPMKNRFRTGMALTMFSLVVFTIVFMGVMVASTEVIYGDTDRISGGFQIQSATNTYNPVKDIRNSIAEHGRGVRPADFKAIGSISTVLLQFRQKDAKENAWEPLALEALGGDFANTVTYGFKTKAHGYKTDRDVWKALESEPDVAVVSSTFVASKSTVSVTAGGPSLRLKGFYQEDKEIPEVYVEMKEPTSGKTKALRVIGVIEPSATLSTGIFISQRNLDDFVGQPVSPSMFWFKVAPGADAKKLAAALDDTFYENGMQSIVTAESIKKLGETSMMMNRLLQGFMGLGLVVGIAALGVIAARSVVERRQQIGMLRAIGFRRTTVQATFLLESSFIALLGIVIGSVLGLLLSRNVVSYMAKDIPGFTCGIPWNDVLVIGLLAYGASLLTTFLPARQASRVFPAEALRYE